MSPALGDAGGSRRPLSPVSNQSTPVAAISCPGKLEVEVDRPLSNGASKTRTTRVPTCNIPHDIVEMIITLLTRDLGDLKACSLTRRSWYIAAAPHLHHTFTLRGNRPDVTRGKLKPLPELHQLGLIPLVKELRIEQDRHLGGWFAPQAFGHNDLRYFSAFKNVHTLKLERMEIYRFMPTINRYFRYLSPTLRSVTLYKPNCTPRQLSHFLSLFLNLDDIEIERIDTSVPDTTVPDTELFPLSAPRLRGRLALQDFRWAETWIHLIALCGSLRFRHIVLCEKVTCAPTLLEACAGTLETLRFHAMDNAYGTLDLSCFKVLRSLQVAAWVGGHGHTNRHSVVMEVFSTITSPVFSELAVVVTSDTVTNLPWDVASFETLRRMNEIRPFTLVFFPDSSDSHREKLGRELERALTLATAQGFLDFSAPYPPSVEGDFLTMYRTRTSPASTWYHPNLKPCKAQGVKLVPP